jgi:hypothetical protein
MHAFPWAARTTTTTTTTRSEMPHATASYARKLQNRGTAHLRRSAFSLAAVGRCLDIRHSLSLLLLDMAHGRLDRRPPSAVLYIGYGRATDVREPVLEAKHPNTYHYTGTPSTMHLCRWSSRLPLDLCRSTALPTVMLHRYHNRQKYTALGKVPCRNEQLERQDEVLDLHKP